VWGGSIALLINFQRKKIRKNFEKFTDTFTRQKKIIQLLKTLSDVRLVDKLQQDPLFGVLDPSKVKPGGSCLKKKREGKEKLPVTLKHRKD